MTSRKIFATVIALALVGFASFASADIIDPATSFATIVAEGGLTASPGGYEAIGPNHTIDVFVNDQFGDPVELISTDIWLQHDDVIWCEGGVTADSSTFAPDPGHTTFTSVARGGVDQGNDSGGWNECSAITLDVIALGYVIETVNLSINSQDLNGDGTVNTQDWAKFGRCKGDANEGLPGCSCADYNEDYYTGPNNVDIADQAQFASQYNLSDCP
ncbi:hypothetical protein H8E52_02170 [bacterium]|nr:hypothetical protein [bacterium]